MFLYLNYTKISLYLEIVHLKILQMSGYGTLNR
jgi:hypothetical protein